MWADIFSMSLFEKLKDRNLGEVSVLQRQFGHALHLFFFRDKSADRCETEGAEKQQQCPDSEPLDAVN